MRAAFIISYRLLLGAGRNMRRHAAGHAPASRPMQLAMHLMRAYGYVEMSYRGQYI